MKYLFYTINLDRAKLGFTLIEVITGMMIAIITVSVTANLFVAANIYKVVAKKNAAMKSLIQSDLEIVRSQSNLLPQDDTKCNANLNTGYANALSTSLVAINSTATIVNNTYTITRTIHPIIDPNILPISYQVTGQGNTNLEYSIYTEVIPNAVFKCPSL
jgi:type II secretory pathway pseudopilin PulG